MKIEKVSLNDYQEISEINKKNYIDILNENDWRNIWQKNPYFIKKNQDWIIGWKITDNAKIYGVILNIPYIFKLNGSEYLAAVCSNYVVEKKYRSFALKLRYLFLNQEGADLLITNSANEKAEKIMEAFKAKKIAQYDYQNRLVFALNKKKIIFNYIKNFKFNLNFANLSNFFFEEKINIKNKDLTFSLTNKFDLDCDQLDRKLTYEKKFFSSKNLDWLNWKYNKYLKKNDLYIVKIFENKNLVGFIVLIQNYEKNYKLKRLSITEIVIIKEKIFILSDVLNYCIKLGKKNNFDVIDAVGFQKQKRVIFEKIGFIKKKSANYNFLIKNNKKELEDTLFNNSDELDLSLTDGDSVLNL
jgi:hypothetical protein